MHIFLSFLRRQNSLDYTTRSCTASGMSPPGPISNTLFFVFHAPPSPPPRLLLSIFLLFPLIFILDLLCFSCRFFSSRSNLLGVFSLLRSADSASARETLTGEPYGLSREQAEALMNLRLARLTAMEEEKLASEAESLQATRAR